MKVAELFILYCRHGEKDFNPKIYLPAKLTFSTSQENKTSGYKLILVKSVFNNRQ
jgi:hypothetical protein